LLAATSGSRIIRMPGVGPQASRIKRDNERPLTCSAGEKRPVGSPPQCDVRDGQSGPQQRTGRSRPLADAKLCDLAHKQPFTLERVTCFVVMRGGGCID
jgi:hypothetical protein